MQPRVVLGARARDHADQRVVMAGQDLGRAVQHEVGAVLERAEQHRAEHRVVDDDDRPGRRAPGRSRRRDPESVIIGFAHGSNHTRSASGGSPVWSNSSTSSPHRVSSRIRPDGAVVAAARRPRRSPRASASPAAARSSRPCPRRTGARGRRRARRAGARPRPRPGGPSAGRRTGPAWRRRTGGSWRDRVPGRDRRGELSLRASRGESRKLDRRAAVHDHEQAGVERSLRRRLVDHPQLHPDGARAGCDRLVHVDAGVLGAAEDVDDLDAFALRDVGEARVTSARRAPRPRSG